MINVTIRYDNNERQIDFPCSGHVLDAKLKNFEILRSSGKPYIIRTPLIPDVCDTEDNLSKIKPGNTFHRVLYNHYFFLSNPGKYSL